MQAETPAEGELLLKKIQQKITMMDKCIQSLLTLSSHEVNRTTSVPLDAIIYDILLELSINGSKPNIVFKDNDNHDSVYGAESELRSIIHAVSINAVEATPNDGEVVVSIDETEQAYKVIVKDTGKGILPEVRARLCQPHITTKAEGTGMGAYIAERLLKGHYGGELLFDDNPDGGTIFLDEIGELPLQLQTNLLRFLQEGVISRLGQNGEIKLDVRVIAATHRDLQHEVAEGRFREDLYYRLNVVPIHMPPLRERQEDIGRLVDHFLKRHTRQYNLEPLTLSASTMKQLLDYPWPGNVRELANRIERFVLLGDEDEMVEELSRLPKPINTREFSLPESGLRWEEFEKDCLEQAMSKHQSNRTKAAKFLGLSYKAFLYRLEKYQLV